MLIRTLRTPRAFRGPAAVLRAYKSTTTTSQQVPANDPVEREPVQNVSETNVTPTSSEGSFDKVLQEDVADAERMRTKQAPNYKGIWSRSQQPREIAMSGPRFEQSIMEDQVCFPICFDWVVGDCERTAAMEWGKERDLNMA
jgi:NADH dehydrogenase (ubiquinone) Fe-S protein 6